MSYPSRVEFPPKLALVVDNYVFDFISAVPAGETISTAVVTAAVYTGIDLNPSLIVNGAASINGTKVTQKLGPTVQGVIYKVLCTVTTSAGRTLILSAYLATPDQSVP